MFPRVGSQIFNESHSPEDFHVMEVENLSRDYLTVTGLPAIASGNPELAQGRKSLCGLLVAVGVSFTFTRIARRNRSRVLRAFVAVQWGKHHVKVAVSQHLGR